MAAALKLVYQRNENVVSAIESGFPHIARQLCARWGKPECLAYLDNLLTYSGGGNSKGFPAEVVEELFSLYTMLQKDFSGVDRWTKSDARI
jgi:hypothetical protein